MALNDGNHGTFQGHKYNHNAHMNYLNLILYNIKNERFVALHNLLQAVENLPKYLGSLLFDFIRCRKHRFV